MLSSELCAPDSMNKDRKMSSILKGYRPKWDAMEGAEKFYDSLLEITGSQNIFFNCTLLGLRQFLATESPLK